MLDGNEPLVAGRIGEVAPEHPFDEMTVIVFEAAHTREMVERSDSHHLGGGQTAGRPCLRPAVNQPPLHFFDEVVHIVE